MPLFSFTIVLYTLFSGECKDKSPPFATNVTKCETIIISSAPKFAEKNNEI